MYHLKNELGNVHKLTDSARKRDELLRGGYVEVAEEKPKAAKEKPKKASKESGDAE